MVTLLALTVALSSFPSTRVVRVIDGDTMVVHLDDVPELFTEMSVRIYGIDTPELRGERKCEKRDARLSKARLETIVAGGFVNLVDCTGDKYWRTLCTVYVGDKNVASQLISEGLATAYFGETKLRWRCRS